jgi:hypothetical protein
MSLPRNKITGACFRNILHDKKIRIISLFSYEAKDITLCDMIRDKDYETLLPEVIRIIMFYETEKGKKKRIVVNNKFSINSVPVYPDGEKFPN